MVETGTFSSYLLKSEMPVQWIANGVGRQIKDCIIVKAVNNINKQIIWVKVDSQRDIQLLLHQIIKLVGGKIDMWYDGASQGLGAKEVLLVIEKVSDFSLEQG